MRLETDSGLTRGGFVRDSGEMRGEILERFGRDSVEMRGEIQERFGRDERRDERRY
ncbi:hypothetical protein DY000_02052493 [Brassica cretica]|uniref:CsbD family protein n=1 Tax=Brassica cretica TaxID=69181 RepID=A0ABQ7A7N1_BRACR|nr:hypothetical protein DY000_02052493 [Brassica cretica]